MESYGALARYDCPKQGSVALSLACAPLAGASAPQHLAASILEPAGPQGDVGSIHVLDASTLALLQVLQGHGSAVEDLCFRQDSPQCLLSCGADGAAKAWDLRVGPRATESTLLGGYLGAVQSICVDSAGKHCACAVSSSIEILDLVAGKVTHSHEDAHSDTISRVRFHPDRDMELLSAGDDGLLCVLDVARCLQGGSAIEEDAGIAVAISTGEMVRSFSCLTASGDLVCTVSTTEVVQLWSIASAWRGCLCGKFEDLRTRPEVSVGESGGTVVDALTDPDTGRAYLVASSVAGDLSLFHINMATATNMGCLSRDGGGHTSSVRAAVSVGQHGSFVTGAEDGAIICWSPSDATKSKKRRKR
mmetsp:Transcript_20460/g.37320  ORF Transcript_20460/g.37320 Transcript_20460/m.37320 type:complete len:361 (-) Transcript_20460:13-1095(-)